MERAGLNLAQVVAVCPVINPANAMLTMEQGLRFYEWYFERKWSRSLRIKQACFQELYGDEQWHEIKSVRERTHYLAIKQRCIRVEFSPGHSNRTRLCVDLAEDLI